MRALIEAFSKVVFSPLAYSKPASKLVCRELACSKLTYRELESSKLACSMICLCSMGTWERSEGMKEAGGVEGAVG